MSHTPASAATLRRYQTLIGLVIFAVLLAFTLMVWRQSVFIGQFQADVYTSCMQRKANDANTRALWESLALSSDSPTAAVNYQKAAERVQSRDCSVYQK